MKRSEISVLPFLAAVLLAAVGFVLGLILPTAGRDSLGFWAAGSPAVIALLTVSGLTVIAAALLCRKMPKDTAPCLTGPAAGIGAAAGGVLICAAGLLSLPWAYGVGLVTAILGVLAGIITLLQAVQRIRGKQPQLLPGCVIVLWLVLQIIGDFKSWSTDPAVLDYCYPLFALLCAMAACYHTAGWLAGLGKGRLTAFWCMCGMFFCAVALTGGVSGGWLIYPALLLLCAQNLWCTVCAKENNIPSA